MALMFLNGMLCSVFMLTCEFIVCSLFHSKYVCRLHRCIISSWYKCITVTSRNDNIMLNQIERHISRLVCLVPL